MSNSFSIYRSSAGSGKTRTLAKEYLKLALSHRASYFRHILAVTFTNKSTQEMKERILKYLNEFATNTQNDLAGELKSELHLDDVTFQQRSLELQQAILHTYNQFSISTIDAFFQKVIRSFTRESGLMGDYRLEVEEDLVLEEVIDDLIDELGENKELTDWVVEFANDNLENERSWDVRQSLREFAQQIFREEFKEIEDVLSKDTNDRSYFKNLKSKLWQTKNSFIHKVSKPAEEALAVFRETGWDDSEISFGKNSGLKTFFSMFAYQKNLKDFKEPSDRMRVYFMDPSNWPSKSTKRSGEIVQTAKQKLIPILNSLITAYDSSFAEGLSAELVLRNMYVFGLLADISRKLKEYKNQNNLMLLADAPKFLNGVIQDSDTPFIYEKIGSFYRNYLMDEFQDTSTYQWKNFLPLLTNSLDQGYRSILVGDVKQAIYRWRGGDLALLQQKVEQQIGKDRISTHPLATNYRSAPLIVQFNNLFFKEAASLLATKVKDGLPTNVFHDVAQQVFKKNTGLVQLDFIKEEHKDDDWKQRALEKIPTQLEQLQQAGVRLNDIAILVRKNDEGQRVASHLLQYSVEQPKPGCRYDVISNESLQIDGAASVNVLLGAMRYLHNPEDAIARAQLAYEFARVKDPDRELSEVFAVSNQATFESNLPLAFTKSKPYLKKLVLFELTETLIEIFKLGTVKGELSYLQAFQDCVLDFYSRERNDLGAFLEWWDENGYKKSVQVSGDVDAVQIVTVHKSKGLQFKYVLVPFCSWNMDHDSFKSPMLWVHIDQSPFNEAGYLPVQYSSRLKESYFASFYENEMVRCYLDNLNLLYVAFTRAEQGLLVTAPYSERNQSTSSVARLAQDVIQSNIELQKYWNGNLLQLKMGEITPSMQSESTSITPVSLSEYEASRWRNQLVIKRSPSVLFEQEENSQLEKVVFGLHMHAVLSRIRYADNIPETLQSLITEGVITTDQSSELSKHLSGLLAQPQLADWFSNRWEVKTEVPIIIPGSFEARMDRLLISNKKAVVIDFKTGEHNKKDIQQVEEYTKILRQMNFTEVEGYVLYLRDGEVVDVSKRSQQKPKVKKDRNQLGLDF